MMINCNFKKIIINIYLLLIILFIIQKANYGHANAQSDLWVSAYYAGWAQGCGYQGYLSPDEIDYSALTHVIHFSIMPNSDGSLDYETNCITPENSEALIDAAHSSGKKVLVSVGCWLTESSFLGATNSVNRTKFIQNLIDFMTSRGYDGIDIDWEPLSSSSSSQYTAFIIELKNALNNLTPRPLLTAAVLWQPSLFATLQDNFDQINIMTYDFAGLWLEQMTWHNSAIYDGGVILPDTGVPAPSVNVAVDDFIYSGVEAQKIGIGIAFFGYVWKGGRVTYTGGVTEPGQIYTEEPTIEALNYYQIMDQYYNPQHYRWDLAAQAAYLSFDYPGSSNDMFISYDNETTCYEKVDYVREKGIGGIIIFQLGGGWRPNEPMPDNLLQSVNDAIHGEPLIITTPSLPSGTIDSSYDETLAATGGISPYRWSVISGNLPEGLSLNSFTGVISGIPTIQGTFYFVVQVMDTNSSTDLTNLSISIYGYPVKIGTPPIYYSTLQDAYDACSNGNIIEIQALEFYEDLSCDQNVSILLKGGYDADYTSNSSYTTINGTLTISNGTIEVENIIIQ